MLDGDVGAAEADARKALAAAPEDRVTRNLVRVTGRVKAGGMRPKKLPIPVLE